MAPLTPLRSGGLSVPTSLSATAPSQRAAGTSAAPSQAAAGTRPSHWSAFVCPVHGIHALIWIYANAAVVLPAIKGKLPPAAATQPANPPTPLIHTHTHTHTHTRPPPVSLHFPRSFPLFCLWLSCRLLGRVGWRLWEPDLLCHTDLF